MQKLVRMLPKRWAKAIETESREWMMRCSCGREVSVWDAGGIRYKAAGNPARLMRCPDCGPTWHHLERRRPADA